MGSIGLSAAWNGVLGRFGLFALAFSVFCRIGRLRCLGGLRCIRCLWRGAAGALVLALGCSPLQPTVAAEIIGLVLDVQGSEHAQVVHRGARHARILTYLEEDSRVLIPDGGQVALSLYQNRSLVRISGPGEYRLRRNRVDVISGAPPRSEVFVSPLAQGRPGARLTGGGSRMRAFNGFAWDADLPADAPFVERVLLVALLLDEGRREEAQREWTVLQSVRPALQGVPLPP